MIKNKYIVILVFFVVIIITNQIIVQLDINRQTSYAKIINIAGKQRTYGLQISKIASNAKQLQNTDFYKKDIKNLEKILDTFTKANNYLLNINNSNYKKSSVSSLFEKNQPFFDNIVSASSAVIKNPNNPSTLNSFIVSVQENENQYLSNSNSIVDEYQHISENRFSMLKKIQLFFITFTSVSLIALFIFIFLPLFRKNKALTFLNLELERFKAKVKKKEKEKKNVEKILERTNTVARIGTWDVDLIKNKINWSKITREIHEVDDNFTPDLNTAINFYKEGYSRNKIQNLITNSIEKNTTYDTELEIITTKNKSVWVRVIGEASFNNNKCVRLYGVFQDINERKIQQLKLKQVNEDLKAIFESGPISIIRTDIDGNVTHFNKGAELLLQYKREEIIGKPPPKQMHNRSEILKRGRELSEIYGQEISGFDVITTVAKKEGFESRRWTYYRKDGTSFPVQLIVTAIKNEEGIVVAFIGVGTDITEIIEKETNLLKTKNNLEVVREKLIDQNKQLANFAHITSHNLRAPISNLQSLLSLHDIAESKEEKDLIFSKFGTTIDHLSSTLNILVEAIKIKEKKPSELVMEELFFDQTFTKTKGLLSGEILKINASIEADFSIVEKINYNQAYLESIFINLISNALRYSSPKRKANIQVKSRIKKGKVQLLFSDNGLGINLEKNGDKLFGLNKVFHRHKDSKGVGLYIVKNQIQSLGGTITCISKVNIGTTFIITF